MSILSKIANLFFTQPAAVDSKALPSEMYGTPGWEAMLGMLTGGKAQWDTANAIWGTPTAADAEKAFETHPIITACTNKIMDTVGEARLEIGRDTLDGWQATKSHPYLDLLHTPMEFIPDNTILQALAGNAVLTGAGYVRKFRSIAGGNIAGLAPIPTSWVTTIPDRSGKGYWLGYRLYGTSSNMVVPVKDFIVNRYPKPGNPAESSGAFHAAYRSYMLDTHRENYQIESLVNLKVPGVVVQTERPLQKKEKEEARREFRDKFGGGNRGDVAFVSGKGEIKALNPLADLDWPGLTGLSELRICNAFGMSPIIIHEREGLARATYSNIEVAYNAFYRSTMRPIWTKLANALTLCMLRQEGETRLSFRFRFDEMPAFQEDLTKKTDRLLKMYREGLIPRRKVITELGYDADKMLAELEYDDAVNAILVERARKMMQTQNSSEVNGVTNTTGADTSKLGKPSDASKT